MLCRSRSARQACADGHRAPGPLPRWTGGNQIVHIDRYCRSRREQRPVGNDHCRLQRPARCDSWHPCDGCTCDETAEADFQQASANGGGTRGISVLHSVSAPRAGPLTLIVRVPHASRHAGYGLPSGWPIDVRLGSAVTSRAIPFPCRLCRQPPGLVRSTPEGFALA